jgi:MFS family permease
MYRTVRDAVVAHYVSAALGGGVVGAAVTGFANAVVVLPWYWSVGVFCTAALIALLLFVRVIAKHWGNVASFLMEQRQWATTELQNRDVHDNPNELAQLQRDYGAWMQRMRDYVEREKLMRHYPAEAGRFLTLGKFSERLPGGFTNDPQRHAEHSHLRSMIAARIGRLEALAQRAQGH